MVAQTLTCPECNAPLEPPPNRTQFFCSFCGSTVVIPPEYQQTKDAIETQAEPLRAAPDLSKFEIQKHGDQLTISWSWRSWLLLFLIPFALFWNGIAWTVGGAFFLAGIGALGNGGGGIGLFGAVFAIPHLSIGLFLIYLILAMIFNRTTISVDRDELKIHHGPLPWRTPKPIPCDAIEQLYVKQKVSHNNNGTSVSYQLHALMTDGKSQKLLDNNQDENTPLAVERMIEVHLGIDDQRVAGDHR